jgi:GDP-L-fucose synthase
MANTDRAPQIYDLAGKRVWVAGDRGMVGSAVVRRLAREDCEILTVPRSVLDLRRQSDVEDWMAAAKADVVFLAAATVGGIAANDSRPADFIYDNLVLETNIIHSAYRVDVERLVFLSSACAYPKLAPQPMAEDTLLTGPLEPTNQWYAIAKIAGVKMCEAYRRQHGCDFISVQPNNLYGPHDNFDDEQSHVIPALMAKAHRARESDAGELVVWGSGTPLREFLFVDDLADALIFLAEHYRDMCQINVGTGQEVNIRALAEQVAKTVGFRGRVVFDLAKPDGVQRKLLDCSRLTALGWNARTDLQSGLMATYEWYRTNCT